MQDQGTDRGTHRCHLYTWDRIPLLDAILGKGQRPEGRFSDKRPKNKPCLAEVFEVKHLSGDGRRHAEHEEAMRGRHAALQRRQHAQSLAANLNLKARATIEGTKGAMLPQPLQSATSNNNG